MKAFVYICALGVCLAGMAVCSCSDGGDDPSLSTKITTPNQSGSSRLAKVERMGAFVKEYAWALSYNKKSLTQAVSTVQEGISSNLQGQSVKYTLSYGSKAVTVSTNGLGVTLEVNSEGLVTAATSGNTTYQYNYQNGYLTSWNVHYKNSGFGSLTTKGAAASVEWGLDGNIYKVEYTPSTDAADVYYTYSFEYGQDLNVNGLLPEAMSEQLGCKGSEYLYYAGMMGRGTKSLVSRITVSYSKDDDYSKVYDFRYTTSGGNVTLCSYEGEDNPVVVTYAYAE